MTSHRFKLNGPAFFFSAPSASAVALLPVTSMKTLHDSIESGPDHDAGDAIAAHEGMGMLEETGPMSRPPRYRATRKREAWYQRLCSVEPGLTLAELAERLESNYLTIQRWAAYFSYPIKDQRLGSDVKWQSLDWSLRNAELARHLDLSRERVRQMRNALRVGLPAPRALIQRFEEFAIAQRDQIRSLTLEETIESFGEPIGLSAARRILRRHDICLTRAQRPTSQVRKLDWRLPNRELAAIWRIDAMKVAAARHRYSMGPAMWDCRGSEKITDPEFLRLRVTEKARARQAAVSTKRVEPKESAPHENDLSTVTMA